MRSFKEIIGMEKDLLEDDEIMIQDILGAVEVGMWKMELCDGEEPRMYGDSTMDKLVGVKGNISPEEYYKIWYTNIVDRYYEKVEDGVAQILSGNTAEIEYLWMHPDLGEIRIRCGGAISKDLGNIKVLKGYHQDVTKMYSLQRIVKSNEEIFASLSNSYNAVFSVNLEEDTYEILKSDNNIEGYFSNKYSSYTELQKKILENIIHYDDCENMRGFGSISNIQKSIEEKRPYIEMMAKTRLKDGSYIWMRYSYIFVEDNNNITSKVLYVSTDINEEFKQMLENDMRDKIFTTSMDITYQTIVKINLLTNMFVTMKKDDSINDITVYEDNYDYMIERVREYVYPDDREAFTSILSRKSIFTSIENGETESEVQYRRLGIDGTYRWKSISIIYMNQEFSKDMIVVGFVKDIDSWKSREVQSKQLLEEALENANKANNAKTEFLSRMSHDIRTPLNAIIGMTTLGKVHIDDSEKIEECLERITISGKILLNLINEVLDMNRIESGKIELYEEKSNILEAMEEVISIIQPMAQKKNIVFEVITDDIRHKTIITDIQRIIQVILNLATNAIKYTLVNGEVKIVIRETTSYSKGYANYRFIVEDNGIGMTEEFLGKIFEPFTRAEDSRVSKIQGTGLGMSIVKNIVDMMNGSISIDSELGKGSKFIVDFPIRYIEEFNKEKKYNEYSVLTTDINSKKELNEDIFENSFNGEKILLVEDNEINREMLCDILEMVKLQVDTAENGREGVDIFNASEQNYYSLILMDVQMPVLNGLDATMEIRKMQRQDAKKIPIIAMTANAFAEDIQKSRRAGMNEHIAKPLEIEYVIKRLKKYIK